MNEYVRRGDCSVPTTFSRFVVVSFSPTDSRTSKLIDALTVSVKAIFADAFILRVGDGGLVKSGVIVRGAGVSSDVRRRSGEFVGRSGFSEAHGLPSAVISVNEAEEERQCYGEVESFLVHFSRGYRIFDMISVPALTARVNSYSVSPYFFESSSNISS